ncbi:hypothetical protein HDU96_007284, partial [Phlyctochytrium bullatum]
STKLPHELDGRISPAEFTRRIALLNKEVSMNPIEDNRIVIYFWMLVASIPLFVVNTGSGIAIYFAESTTHKIIAGVIALVTTIVILGMIVKYNQYAKTPFQSDKIAGDLMKSWSNLDAERRLLWISKRTAWPHPRRTLAPWTIEIHERAAPTSVVSMYPTNSRMAPAPTVVSGNATQLSR